MVLSFDSLIAMRISNTFFGSLVAIASSPAVSAYADPEACSGVCVNAHDPTVIRRKSDGTYFRFSTGGKIAIHTAPSLSGPWKYECAMLPSGSSIPLKGNDDLWAPDIAQVGDEYYIYYTVSSFGVQNSAIGLATSPTMDCGSFKDLGTTGVESREGDNYNAIDGNLFRDGNKWLFNFGSFWSNLYQVDMADPPVSLTGSERQLSFEPAGEHPEEAPYMVKHDDFYYLFYSVGKCCGYDADRPAPDAEYKIKVCRSSSATGGFVSNMSSALPDRKTCTNSFQVDAEGTACTEGGGTVVLESHGNVYGPGGQGVYNDPVEGWVLYYHFVNTQIGYSDGQKQFGWNKIAWNNGWPTV